MPFSHLKLLPERTETMNKHTHTIIQDMEQLTHDASALVAATADMAGDHVEEARQRLAAGISRAREIYALARGRALDGSRAADVVLHDNLYQVVAAGIVVGAFVGFLLATRCPSRRE